MFWQRRSRRRALILAVVEDKGPVYPEQITGEIAARTNGDIKLVIGHVYVSLVGYEKKGWVECEKLLVYDCLELPPIVHYTITEAGCAVLERMRARGLLSIGA